MIFVTFFQFDQYKEIFLSFLGQQIYLAPLLLIFLEEAGLPLSLADFVIAYTGYHVALGHISFVTAFVLLLITDLLGASLLFLLSKIYGQFIINKFGKYIDLDEHKLDKVATYFRKYGPLVIIVGRHIIGMRIPTIVFAGISKMNYFVFLGSTFLSVSLWIYFYLSVGMRLGPQTISLLHSHGWDSVIFILPIILTLAPFFFLRKNAKRKQ